MIVIGAGPNGLFAAARLARAGRKVLVLEANGRPGGALWSLSTTKPGFVHDVGAGFVCFHDTPAFQGLQLGARGLRWAHGTYDSAHPATDGTCAAVARDLDRSAATFGPDADTWRELVNFHRRIEPHVLEFLGPFPQLAPALAMGPRDGFRLLRAFLRSSGRWARRTFQTEAARRVLPAMGLHVDVGPQDRFGVPLCWMLAMRATTAGYAVPVGGAASISRALVADLQAHGGQVRTSARVARVLVRNDRAAGVALEGGEELSARAVVADTAAPSLFLDLLEPGRVSRRIVRAMRRFPQGWGTFKLDLALNGPVPWSSEVARSAAVVHVGDSVDELAGFTRDVRRGSLPMTRPYLVVGQHSLVDATRAPPGAHTLYVYTHVPSQLDAYRYPGGWLAWRERLADAVVDRISDLAPGFAARVTERAIHDPSDLEKMDANLVGGDLGGGSNAWTRQLVFRPVFPWFRYRTPVAGLYLGSSYAHPGAGIHGMCGWNAAGMVLEDLEAPAAEGVARPEPATTG
ncbi:MAG: NAD(P)/FAD-dependent oxidoreductase [Myxococcota bacterium]